MRKKNINKTGIEEIANEFVKHINESNVKDPFLKLDTLNEKMGVKIILVRFPGEENISGYSYVVDNYFCIYINSNHSLGRQYCSFWHEIYHCINDERENNQITKLNYEEEEESEANYFSYCVLLQRNNLKDEIYKLNTNWGDIEIGDMIKLQNIFRVSMQALIYRLNEVFETKLYNKFIYITKVNHVQEFKEQVIKMGYCCELILPTLDFCVPRSFISNIYDNIQNKRISWEDAAEVIEILEDKGVKVKW